MISFYLLLWQLLSFYSYIIIAHVICSWLISLHILNPYNNFVYLISDLLYRFTMPSLNFIRRFLPRMMGLDFSPAIVLLLIYFMQGLMQEYLLPIILRQ